MADFFYSDDPVRDAERHDAQQNQRLHRRPECYLCEQPIQDDHYYKANGENICPQFLQQHCYRSIEEDF